MRRCSLWLSLIFVAIGASSTLAAVPQLINLQSLVTDSAGNPYPDGTHTATFSIYDDQSGGSLLWTETNNTVGVLNSRFNVLLGSIEPLHDSVFAGIEAWLEIEFDGVLVGKRVRLVSSGYAHRISTVDGARGGEISGDVLIDATSNANALEVRQHTAGSRAGRFENTSLTGTEAALLGVSNGSGAGVVGFNPWGGPGMSCGGGFSVTDENFHTKFEVNPYGTQGGGNACLRQSSGDTTIELIATQAASQFGRINFYRNGINTVAISGGNASQAGEILLYDVAGAINMSIDGENSSGGGRIVVYHGADANLGGATVGYVQLGVNSGPNLLLDNDEIIARNSGQASTLMLQADGGAVGIGTAGIPVPSGYIFAVDGKAIMEEVEVQLSADWPDYVFEDDYDLPSLDDLARHVKSKKHLPGIPSAAEMDGQRLPLGEMQSKLLEKVEELTLYVLQLKQDLDHARTANAELEARIDEIEANRQSEGAAACDID